MKLDTLMNKTDLLEYTYYSSHDVHMTLRVLVHLMTASKTTQTHDEMNE